MVLLAIFKVVIVVYGSLISFLSLECDEARTWGLQLIEQAITLVMQPFSDFLIDLIQFVPIFAQDIRSSLS